MGIFTVLNEVRKTYWIPQLYSLVKVLKSCTNCRRFNNKPININQSSYRDWRVNPTALAYRQVFLDFCGPFTVTLCGNKIKVYVLLITCLWSRSVNLVLCRDLTEKSFLEDLQLHIHEYGVASLILSDMGSHIVRGSKTVQEYIEDSEIKEYLELSGIESITFEQYVKGRNELGGLVEVMVKLVKRLLYGSIRNLVLDYFEFAFVVSEVKNLTNRRPVAFKESLRDTSGEYSLPSVLTPEMLVHGFELPTLHVIPGMHQSRLNVDKEWRPASSGSNLHSDYDKIVKTRANLAKLYNEEFLTLLLVKLQDLKICFAP